MFKGFYTAATGMIAQQRRTEILSNNVANANTPGYKADQSTVRAFPNMLLSAIQKSGKASLSNGFNPNSTLKIGELGTGVYVQETIPDYTQGQLVQTDLKTDIGMSQEYVPENEDGSTGALFFRLQTDTGEAYTRNGNFTQDGSGNLVTSNGNYVLSTTGEPIQLQSADFQVTTDGQVIENDELVAQIDVAYAEDPNRLLKQDNGLYYTEEDEEPLESIVGDGEYTYSLNQGYVEQSNVDAASTMTEMMSAYRSFEANQKMLQAYDRSMDKAVNEIGKV
ncbi:flagellar hook-basal body protein [Kurthia massiliensis]|uniref:flagellar hook-basal body protein n=1 Tax=Kurthia massiliensis TaxID=1033739 RepID=UPI000288CB17|nr:flagellar hook-basal body protein [Kurthia massiliensis]